MRFCLRSVPDSEGNPTGELLDISLVHDDHEFGLREDGCHVVSPYPVEVRIVSEPDDD